MIRESMPHHPHPKVIKFLHPGSEWVLKHTPKGDVLPWNNGPHKRKYLEWSGSYLDRVGAPVARQTLRFWAKWEAPSKIFQIFNGKTPKALHQPIQSKKSPWRHRNTDPMVFNNRIFYSNCQQLRKKGPTQQHDLPDGSLILFGFCKANLPQTGFRYRK